MSYIESLLSVEKKIKIENKGLKITEDPLLLSKNVKKVFLEKKINKKNLSLLEIGAGQGIISILLSEIENIEKIYAVEIQKEIFNYLEENIKLNKLNEKIIPINEDIKNVNGNYDIIVTNPPYNKLNSGKLPEDISEKISKYEEKLTLEELFITIKKLLKNHGYFFVILPNNRLNDAFFSIYTNNLNIISLEITQYKKRQLVIIFGKKGGEKNSNINIYINDKINNKK